MSDTTASSSVYQCATVMVFWNDSTPGANDGKPNLDRFYLRRYRLRPWSQEMRTQLESDILTLVQAHQGAASVSRVAYVTREPLLLTNDEIQSKGWHFIDGGDDFCDDADPVAAQPQPQPQPAAPEPVTEPPATPPAAPATGSAPAADVAINESQEAALVRFARDFAGEVAGKLGIPHTAAAIAPWFETHPSEGDQVNARKTIGEILGETPSAELYQAAVAICLKTITYMPGWSA